MPYHFHLSIFYRRRYSAGRLLVRILRIGVPNNI